MNPSGSPHVERPRTRRDFLLRSGGGFGAMALAAMLSGTGSARAATHHPARARRVIFLFMEGGPSHIDLFDPKPELNRLAGQRLPASFPKPITAMGESNSPLLACKREWRQHGQSGLWISDWLPQTARFADDLCVLRSCWADGVNHSSGICQMNTGSILAGRPSLGSWVNYALGTENTNLPGFVVLQDGPAVVVNGARNWGAGFMPATYQGVPFSSGPTPVDNLRPAQGVSSERQAARLSLLDRLNRTHAGPRSHQTELDARIRAYELAGRMQLEAPEAVDISRESAATQRLYGIDRPQTATMGRLCLLARRLVERDVRFVQIYHGAGNRWDAHAGIEKNHAELCASQDQPVAGLLADLKARGLLEDTLVIWGGEFGRTPMSEKGDGRDHNPTGFTMWLAGGGVRGGRAIGTTDDLGLHAVEDRIHIHDLHATLLWLLGLDHTAVIYRHQGRPERPTVNEGDVVRKVVV
jgi:uncharacterized protein (DUF1501 family)